MVLIANESKNELEHDFRIKSLELNGIETIFSTFFIQKKRKNFIQCVRILKTLDFPLNNLLQNHAIIQQKIQLCKIFR